MTAVATSNHPFERAGLGIAPFRCVRVEYRVGPIKYVDPRFPGVTCEVGSPGQPMGCCDYCGQGIAECCVIRDANGTEFIVGNQCVWKAAREHGKSTELERDRKRALRDARAERERTASAELTWRLANDNELQVALHAVAHPMGFKDRTTGAPLTMLDWARWMMKRSGAAGRTRVRRAIDKLTMTREDA